MPFTSNVFGISVVVREGWEETSPGIYVRSSLGLVVLRQQAAPYVGTENLPQRMADSLFSTVLER